MTRSTEISRREALWAGGAAISGAALSSTSARGAGRGVVDAAGVCFLTPDIVDGPYYKDKAIVRQDITEGRKGIPLELRVRLVDAACRPIAGARVDTWQADALGIYSDFAHQGDDLSVATMGQTFLRGTQMSDANGLVVFRTIYPGWYRARTAHIHFKIHLGGRTRLTTQLFFPDALNEFIYTQVPGYTRSAIRDTLNVTDWILADSSRATVAQIREEADRYVASIIYGVNPLATPAPSEKMPCPAEGLCVPTPNTPPPADQRVAGLVPSAANAARPRAQKPALPPR